MNLIKNLFLKKFFMFTTTVILLSSSTLIVSCKKNNPDASPTAAFTVTQESAHSYKILLDASTSKANTTSITSYLWTFGDGQTSTLTTASGNHTYAGAGTYTISLTVTNDKNKQSTAQTQITLATIIVPPTPTTDPTATPTPEEDTISKWSASNLPLDLRISDAFNSSEIALVTNSVNTWEAATLNKINFFNVNSTLVANKTFSTIFESLDDSEMGIYKSTTWFAGESSQTLAFCVFEGYIINKDMPNEYLRLSNFDIIFNYRDHQFRTTDAPSGNKIDFLSVLIHEMGHSIGLNHSPSGYTDSIMKPSISPLENIHQLSAFDEDTIRDLYADLIAAAGPSGMNDNNSPEAQSASESNSVPNGILVRGYRSISVDGTEKTIYHPVIR
ncbi:MAG: matrixin family metalloprotease [Oligoflexia bacterium]|nr:matrixin family metalloprotease [Oligoflexia bacterium]